jgi:ABC-type multidrug transport system fused ATPase/permease subunit
MRRTPFDDLPVADPGKANLDSSAKFLLWIASHQRKIIFTGTFFGVINLLSLAIMPGILGNGIQAIADEDFPSLSQWVSIALLAGVLQAISGILRHRRAVGSWISAATRLQQLVTRKAVQLGADLPKLISTGEVSAVNSNDVERVARVFDLIPRLVGAIISFLFVAAILISSSSTLGLMVVIGVPLLSLLIAPIIKPLQNRESLQREKLSYASELAADTVAGLRILRGIGGEEAFITRFQRASQEVRKAAVKTARTRAILDGLQILLPGALIVGVIWIGGLLVNRGELKVGQLLAFYGYSSFLMIPLQILTESAQRITAGVVSVRRVMKLLIVEPLQSWGEEDFPANFSFITDEESGLVLPEGKLTVVVCDISSTGDLLAERLGGFIESDTVRVDGTFFNKLSRHSLRKNILSQEKEPALLSGTIASHFAVENSGEISIESALTAASALDILDSLEGEGLRGEVVERGRTLSGGQRQRLALARSLFADPKILLLDDPTSAVDAHTESRIAQGIRQIRAGKTTVIFSASPLILDQSDMAMLVIEGKVAASGTHSQLLKRDERYRTLVVRGAQ